MIYLAAAYDRQKEIKAIALELQSVGVPVLSRWLDEQDCPPNQDFEDFLADNALKDIDDLNQCHTLVRFTDDLSTDFVPSRIASGARMFETGYAYSQGKRIIVVGGHQNVFDRLPGIIHLSDKDELKAILKRETQHAHD